jgi:hypothetical protein
LAFDAARHQDLIRLLAKTGYSAAYLDFCAKYRVRVSVDGPHINKAPLLDIFRNLGVKATWHKGFRTVDFDAETIHGWDWKGTLVIQRSDGLEPMLEGHSSGSSVGDTLMRLALHAGELSDAPVAKLAFKTTFLENPPVHLDVPYPRPQFDGDMRTMERIVLDLVTLFRTVKDAIRQNW